MKNKTAVAESLVKQLDWPAIFEHAYETSLELEEGSYVPHGTLSTALQTVGEINGNSAASTVIKQAASDGTLEVSAGTLGNEYVLERSGNSASAAFKSVPAELKELDQWVCWRYQERDGKPAKVPIDPTTGARAKVNQPETWTTFPNAVTCYESNPERTDGIGFVFSVDDPYVGIDFDNCVTKSGFPGPEFASRIKALETYTEYSPSRTGFHCIIKGSVPDGKNRSGNVEIYDCDRFFTVTGERFPVVPETIESRQAELDRIHAEHLGQAEENPVMNTGGGSTGASNGRQFSDDELIEKALRSKKGAEFRRLWNGDISGHSSQSEADAALCSRLAYWTGRDPKRMDRLFRQSGLMRTKWDAQRGDRTYGQCTIEAVRQMVDNTYNSNYSTESDQDNSQTASGRDRYRRKVARSENPQNGDRVTVNDVREVVIDEFDEETWLATEAVLAGHATLLIDEPTATTGVVLVGPSSSGKTTVLRFFEDPSLTDMFYRTDRVTPAAFVSHDASKTEEELEKIDLIPRVRKKTLLARDMATWFAGDEATVQDRMGVMVNILDGEGYTCDSGTHGSRGYEGPENRFNFIGATTPLPQRTWHIMGSVGNRLAFYERKGQPEMGKAVDDVVSGENDYDEKVSRCRDVIRDYLLNLWEETGGPLSITWEQRPEPALKEHLGLLAEVVVRGRAPIREDASHPEGPHRIVRTLWNIARGRALLDGRRNVRMEDMQVSARIALSTMPYQRRPIVQALLNPANDSQLTSREVEAVANITRPTAISRIKDAEILGFGVCNEIEDDGRGTKVIQLNPELEWPADQEFPEI